MRLTVAHILAVLAVPGVFLSFWLFPKYVFLSNLRTMDRYHAAALVDKTFFLALSMIVIGFITILQWNSLFPDRRDYMILGPLPVPLRTVFGAKLIALFVFLAVFCADINFSSTFVFPIVVGDKNQPLSAGVWHWITHATCVFAASAFIFFLFVALQGLLMNLLSHRWFRRVSFLVQALALFALLASLLLLPRLDKLLPALRAPGFRAGLFPPLWFLGLYETMLGRNDPLFRSLAATALAALALVLGVTLAAYFVSYKRHVKRSLEAVELLAAAPSLSERYGARLLSRWLLKTPSERASFFFLWTTLLRSPRHKLFLATYAGLGFAFVLEGFIALLWARGASLDRPTPMLLSIPLVLTFFLLSGMRIIFTIPAELRANWVFRVTENHARAECLSGVRKAVYLLAFAPVFGIALPFYAYLWNWPTAIAHVLFCIALSLLLLEALLHNFHKIPFTCAFLPGRANLPGMFAFYWLAFTLYAYAMAALELWMMRNPVRLVVFLLLVLVAFVRLRARWSARLGADFRLVFEEIPEPAVLTLNLDSR